MNPCLLIPLIVAAVLLPLATGGNPLRIWRDTGCLILCIAAAATIIHLLATATHSYP